MSDPISLVPDTGSFRDPSNQVYSIDGVVFRALSQEGLDRWAKLNSTLFFKDALRKNIVVASERVDVPLPKPLRPDSPWRASVLHARIPFISYPYEWSFGMLKESALLTLSLLRLSLTEEWILSDSSPYNVQWLGASPQFIDIGSFIPWMPGQPWMGYRQFCELFLYPLMLYAYKEIPFQPWLRGSLEGIPSSICQSVLGITSLIKPGVFKHVWLHALLQNKSQGSAAVTRQELTQTQLPKSVLLNNVRGLEKIVQSLELSKKGSGWINYGQERNYSDSDYDAKREAVKSWLKRRRRKLVWDVGCNTGDFAEAAAQESDYVIAMDQDPVVVDAVFRRMRQKNIHNVLPLVMNIANPSPSQGWSFAERKSLIERGRPDLILALAVIHHLVFTSNIPLEALIAWFAAFKGECLIEFIDPLDPRVQQLAQTKDIQHSEYQQGYFETVLRRYFDVSEQWAFRGGQRILYACTPLQKD